MEVESDDLELEFAVKPKKLFVDMWSLLLPSFSFVFPPNYHL
jgi:hypothetical protein